MGTTDERHSKVTLMGATSGYCSAPHDATIGEPLGATERCLGHSNGLVGGLNVGEVEELGRNNGEEQWGLEKGMGQRRNWERTDLVGERGGGGGVVKWQKRQRRRSTAPRKP